MSYKIIFYERKQGDSPIDDFLDSLSDKARAKVMAFIALLEEHGPNLKRPYSDILVRGIRELRIQFSSNQYRLLYFFFLRDKAIITNGFTKKTKTTPKEEIERAKRRKKDFITQYKGGAIKT